MHSRASRLGLRKPQNKIEWTLWIGAGFILLAIISSLLFVKKPQEIPLIALTAVSIAHFLQNIGMGIIATAVLLDGLRRLRSDEMKTKGYAATIGGVLLFALMIGGPASSSLTLSNIQTGSEGFIKVFVEEHTQTHSKRELSLDEAADTRKGIAEQKYFHEGVITEYIDVNGDAVKLQPTQENREKREAYLAIPRTIRILRFEAIFWTLVFFAAVAGSLIYHKRQPRKV